VDKDFVIAAVTRNGSALQFTAEALKNDASFFWRIWNIQELEKGDIYRKAYINQYLLKKIGKFSLGVFFIIDPVFLLNFTIALPFPALVFLIAVTVIGAIYTFNKVVEHSYGFFKAQAELSKTDTEVLALAS